MALIPKNSPVSSEPALSEAEGFPLVKNSPLVTRSPETAVE